MMARHGLKAASDDWLTITRKLRDLSGLRARIAWSALMNSTQEGPDLGTDFRRMSF